MAFIRNIAFDNAVSVFPTYNTLQNPAVITLDALQTTYDIDIPCIGHDGQVGVEIDCPDVTLLALQVFPFGVRVTVEVALVYTPGTYNIYLHGKGRSTEGIYTNHQLVLAATSDGVQYSTAYDIDPHRKTWNNKRVEALSFTADKHNFILIADGAITITLPAITYNNWIEYEIHANGNNVQVDANASDLITGLASINLTGYDSVRLKALLPNTWLIA